MYHIAIFGGTFDPIHNGHLQTSLAIQSYFQFDTYLFLPCKIPTIKAPTLANSQQRIKMIELAINVYPGFKLDLREIERDSPSYMVETLQSFREEFQDASITLIMGYDAFISLPSWHQWEKLITLANLLVINRDEFILHSMPIIIQKFLEQHQSTEKSELLNNKSGVVLRFDAGHYDISSTMIRKEIKQKKDVRSKIPIKVYQYIKDEGLYQ